MRVFSREKGHSAVAAAAYRSGQKLVCERTGTVHRYEQHRGVVTSFILMPAIAPDRFTDRMMLWNAAEEAETRKNSRVAREVIIALPYELSVHERESLTRDMAGYLAHKYRVALDVAIHSPVTEDGHDHRNHHAHLLFTTRELTPEGFGAKTRILDDKVTGPQQIEIIRDVWETLANDALSRSGHSDVRIDRRTLEAQGVERIPQIHEGKAATYAEDPRNVSKSEGDDNDKEDEDEDSDDGDTDTKKSGTGDKGSLSPDMSVKDAVEKHPAKEDKADIKREAFERTDKDKTRSEFNADIKTLNRQRKEFPDRPLNLQIAEIEDEIDHLDHRVERLETLLDKTSLPQKLQRLISDIAAKATAFLAERIEGQNRRDLSQTEKTERHERQIARYGRTYREGIHSQIADMKEKIETLQSRETEYKKYRSFVTMIETEVVKIRAMQNFSVTVPQKSVIEAPTNHLGKTAVKGTDAPLAKDKIPTEYKPSAKAEKLQESFGKAIKEQTPTVKTPDKEVLSKSSPVTITVQPDMKQEANKPTEAKSQVTATTTTATPHDYKIKANEQTQKMLDKIQIELKQQKAQEAAQKLEQPKATGKDGTLKNTFHKQEPPPMKEADFINKTKAEAEKKRQNTPPEYRAKPYTEAELNPKSQPEPKATASPQDEGVLDKFKRMWKQETAPPPSKQSKPEGQPKPRKSMSSAFNQAAAKPKDMNTSPEAEQKPEVK